MQMKESRNEISLVRVKSLTGNVRWPDHGKSQKAGRNFYS